MNILIVNYHVGETYPFPGVNGISTEKFRSQIQTKQRYKIVGQSDLSDLRHEEDYCLLTFDDGLKCHINEVLPILKLEDIPGAFFIGGQPLMEKKALTTLKLHYILANIHYRAQQ